MANPEKVTVDKAYFDALLRRADFHTATQLLGCQEPSDVTISRVEYDSLLRIGREFQCLKDALFQGGITGETLDLLISSARQDNLRKDSGIDTINPWNQDFPDQMNGAPTLSQSNVATPFQGMPWRSNAHAPTFNLAPGSGPFHNGNSQPGQGHLRVPNLQRQVSYGMSSVPEDTGFVDDADCDESHHFQSDFPGVTTTNEKRTLYFNGLSDRTSYRDLLSVVKGGKILSVNMRNERAATVTFLDGAADFLTWAKRNDIYLHAKRVEVKWADRQYQLNGHISNKISNGATRNIVINLALDKGLTESRIREDMEHIHNLVIIDITFRGNDAYVSMNSVHNALFARTCMMSRREYKGCKIEFFRDECDTPLPARKFAPKTTPMPAPAKKAAITNRFDMLNIDGGSTGSDEENRTPSDDGTDDETIDDMAQNVGVSLKFLDTDSI